MGVNCPQCRVTYTTIFRNSTSSANDINVHSCLILFSGVQFFKQKFTELVADIVISILILLSTIIHYVTVCTYGLEAYQPTLAFTQHSTSTVPAIDCRRQLRSSSVQTCMLQRATTCPEDRSFAAGCKTATAEKSPSRTTTT